MAVPQRRISKTRKRLRRTHFKLSVSGLVTCPQCGAMIKAHHVCPKCVLLNLFLVLLILLCGTAIVSSSYLATGISIYKYYFLVNRFLDIF